MTELNEVYRCEICGNMVEMVHGGKGQLVCCGEPMKKMVENTVDASREKHIPIVEKTSTGILVEGRQCRTPHGGETLYRVDRGPGQRSGHEGTSPARDET